MTIGKMKVLILNSVDDGLTMQRKMRMDESPILSKYLINHSYAIELTDKQKMLSMETMMSQIKKGQLDEVDMFNRLKKAIIKYKPDVLVVHTGFVFSSFPSEITSVLDRLKFEFPDLKIGMQRMRNLYDSEQVADIIDDFF
jgi:hypothetical protein